LWHIQLQLTLAQVFQDTAQPAAFVRGVNEDLHVVMELSELARLKPNQVLVKFFLRWYTLYTKLSCWWKKCLGLLVTGLWLLLAK
jgi:hypothetical protein